MPHFSVHSRVADMMSYSREGILALLRKDMHPSGALCNALAQLKAELGLFWVGIYLLHGENKLSLGPFQGQAACTIINFGKGVCGTAAMLRQTQVVANVDEFPGYIACHPEVKSEVVVPILAEDRSCIAVLDADSALADYFESAQVQLLEDVGKHLLPYITPILMKKEYASAL